MRTIRTIKAQLASRVQAAPAARAAALRRSVATLTEQLGAVEAEIYQVKNESGQDPLNYPIKLNNQIAALAGVVASTEAKPTAQSYEVYRILAAALDVELGKLKGLLGAGLDSVNAELAKLGLDPVAK